MSSSKILDKASPPTLGCFIDNEYRKATGETLTLVNPKDGSTIREMPEASEADVDAAVASALKAYKKGPWATYTGEARGKCLSKLADLVEQHAEEIAYFESLATGRPFSLVLHGDLPRVASVIRYYAGWADKIRGDSFPPEDGFYKIVEQCPLGVCAAITAWNGSLHFLAWKAGPALACGNTVVLKPSEKSPLGSLCFGHLIAAAGFPPGAFNIVVGGRLPGQVLAKHMDVAKVSFTGSTATGRHIQAAATSSNLKRVTLELGGKSPAVVFEDANLDTALFWAVLGITINSGQVCAATSRLYVQESIAEQFIEKMKAQFEGITSALGADPQDPTCQFGPLVDKIQYDKVWQYIEGGKEGGKLITGGKKPEGKGYYVPPTIFMDPGKGDKIYKEEVFGPVLCVRTFKTEEEALELANDTAYGLSGAVFTQSLTRSLRFGRAMEGGTICINCAAMFAPQVPNGGFKISGAGRELGEYAIRHYTEPRALFINMNA